MATRRAILGGIAAGLGVLACRRAPAQPAERAAYVGIETSVGTGVSRARFFAASGAELGAARLDFRAHGMAAHGDRLVVFPRRPGDRFALVDRRTLEIVAVRRAPPGRRFYGHGAYTVDGAHLLTTENDLGDLDGGVGVYETAPRLRRLGAIALPGPGPHEIIREPERDRFHIALGGLQTHPAYGRTPLNLADFQSRLLTLDFSRGSVAETAHWPEADGVSFRHLAADGRGGLYVGGQWADPSRGAQGPVLWRYDGQEAVAVDDGGALAGYVSSVACAGDAALATSKESGVALRLERGRIVERRAVDGASAAALGPGLTAVSGFGALALNDAAVAAAPGAEFDNHGLALLPLSG